MNKVFIGYDERQPVAFHVAAQSIIDHVSQPVSIVPLVLKTLPITRVGLTPFTYSRFLVPFLCDYEGTAVFMDSDFLCRGDIAPLFDDYDFDIAFVPHSAERQFERASLMVMKCRELTILTPEYVQTAKGLLTCSFASRPAWLAPEWNHLVGYDAPKADAKLAHFTQGLPCYSRTFRDEFGSEWREVAETCKNAGTWEELMGHSVHAPHVEKRSLGGHNGI